MAEHLFISYRRDTDAWAAGRLRDALARHFGGSQIFMDVHSLRTGFDFTKALNENLEKCTAFIAILGPGWAELTDSAGNRRLDNEKDFVRIELEAALKRDIPVVPVLINGAKMPTAEALPAALELFAKREAFPISFQRFKSNVDDLAGQLRKERRAPAVHPDDRLRDLFSRLGFCFIDRKRESQFAEFYRDQTYWQGQVAIGTSALAGIIFTITGTIESRPSGGSIAILLLTSPLLLAGFWLASFSRSVRKASQLLFSVYGIVGGAMIVIGICYTETRASWYHPSISLALFMLVALLGCLLPLRLRNCAWVGSILVCMATTVFVLSKIPDRLKGVFFGTIVCCFAVTLVVTYVREQMVRDLFAARDV